MGKVDAFGCIVSPLGVADQSSAHHRAAQCNGVRTVGSLLGHAYRDRFRVMVAVDHEGMTTTVNPFMVFSSAVGELWIQSPNRVEYSTR